MLKSVIYLLLTGLIITHSTAVFAENVSQQNSTSTQPQKQTQSGVVTKFKEVFQKNEQKPKSMRSKDIVKAKEKIRQQELLKKQKENEIRYLERKMQEKQKTLERLEK